MRKWFKLDNAAKVFPSVTSKRRSNLFRLSFNLKEKINPEILREALSYTMNRFPSMKVKLKKGFFWYYLEPNHEEPRVYEESPYICNQFRFRENNGYLLRVSYFDCRIAIEVFHGLTDGVGALEFLKALVYNYLVMKGNQIESENLILTDIENISEEYQDSFLKNYDKRYKSKRRERKALQWRGTLYQENWLALISGTVSVAALKEVAHRYNATITEFLAACVIQSAYQSPTLFENKRKPFIIFIPVDLRRIFPSRTLRNFSLYARAAFDLDNQLSFEEIIAAIKADMSEQLQKENMQARIFQNVQVEKNIFLRLVPLAIKEIALRTGYRVWGDNANSLSFSNIGRVVLPEEMMPYIDKIEFCNGASYRSPVNFGVISFGDKLVMTFASAIVERDLQLAFFRQLSGFGLDVVIETNELEL
ncbi:MAG: hypothetical protein GX204_06050 [Acholeplasmataceae bacterium]|nr:hypothetical protein [Acholeplasmataceae bacterium]